MGTSPFRRSISDLRRPGASVRHDHVEAPVEWRIEMSSVDPETPLEADLDLRPVSGGVVVTGPVRFAVEHTCHRCLDEFVEDVTLHVRALFADADTGDEDDYLIEDGVIDLEPMLRDEVLLSLPLLPTCGPECRGLVAATETGLNTESPDEEDLPASPFSVLRDLFVQGE